MNYLGDKIKNKSRKMRLISDIKKDIILKLQNLDDERVQELTRLCRYLTKTPLWDKGKTDNGELINQPDLTIDLSKKLKAHEDVNVNSRGVILIPYAFSEELLKEESILIFIHCPRGTFRSHMGKYQYAIRIAYMMESNILEPYGDERVLEIASRICDIFDDEYTSIEKEINGDVKKIRYKYEIEDTSDYKLSKQGYSIRDIVLSVDGVVVR